MQRIREAIDLLNPREAYLVSDRTVEILMNDGRTIRITAAESLRGDGAFSADHEIAVSVEHDQDTTITAWANIDLPWATGDSIEDCLANAIIILIGS